MSKSLIAWSIILCFMSFNAIAKSSDSPFAKKNTLNIGKDISWKIDKESVLASKSATDDAGTYYHLQFDNKQLKLLISDDAAGHSAKKFNQFQINNVRIDGKQSPLFRWCLKNQQRHSRFLQEGLSVKKDICVIDGGAGTFIMRLNKATLQSLQEGSRLSILTKPFRTPLELNYDISDFKDMVLALNARPAPLVTMPIAVSAENAKPKQGRKCWAGAPPKYSHIKSVEYDCDDAVSKKDAELWLTKLVTNEREKQGKLDLEKESKRQLAAKQQQKAQANKLRQQALLQAEAAAVTAAVAVSEAKQAVIGGEITAKMVAVCDKFWRKGEHRCYCQKYIEHAPESIQSNSTCE